ncbi:hypothetical protein GDO81_029702 [Engystomops pustulosus]|uniref:Uncharacterized protein n=1 Tax=Engystomops pustulosus TaxID=76066 RepID=A0AAV6ZJX7_ENGPU|nr:hypothetical protein GDO81_029702 [Engystomops pustulosus]
MQLSCRMMAELRVSGQPEAVQVPFCGDSWEQRMNGRKHLALWDLVGRGEEPSRQTGEKRDEVQSVRWRSYNKRNLCKAHTV